MRRYGFRQYQVAFLILAACGLAFAAPSQNASFNVPQISAISCDGILSDWSNSTEWSLPFITWYGNGLSSTTKAKFAWNEAADVLYVAIQTNESSRPGGHVVVGVGYNASTITWSGLNGTQLCFDVKEDASVQIRNEIAVYGGPGGIDGVSAGQVTSAGVTTYEITIPFWANWATMSSKLDLFAGGSVYVYALMEDTATYSGGTNMTYNGNPNFAGTAMGSTSANLTLVGQATCQSQIALGLGLKGDLNQDCYTDLKDFALFAQSWMRCIDPQVAGCESPWL